MNDKAAAAAITLALLTTAQGALVIKQQELATAETAHQAKVNEKDAAQLEHDDEIDSLNDEQTILTDVIDMLENLHGKHTNSNICLNGNGPTDNGGWELVRRVKAGNAWHPAADGLRGFSEYGAFVDDPQADSTFSKKFDNEQFNQFLFITGDCDKWLIATKDAVIGEFYSNSNRPIISSSKSSTPYQALWYYRCDTCEDPWVSTIDHGPAIGAGEILYGENNFGSTHAAAILPQHNGANVFIRQA